MAANPESITPALRSMDSGFARIASKTRVAALVRSRPGMTGVAAFGKTFMQASSIVLAARFCARVFQKIPRLKRRGGRRAERREVRCLHALFSESVAPLGAPSRLSRGPEDRAAQLQAALPGTWPAAGVTRCRPVPAQRAPRSLVIMPGGRSPGAARERAERRHARGRRSPSPTSRRNRFMAPQGDGLVRNMVLECGGIMS
jgi:hypothetical protein